MYPHNVPPRSAQDFFDVPQPGELHIFDDRQDPLVGLRMVTFTSRTVQLGGHKVVVVVVVSFGCCARVVCCTAKRTLCVVNLGAMQRACSINTSQAMAVIFSFRGTRLHRSSNLAADFQVLADRDQDLHIVQRAVKHIGLVQSKLAVCW